MRWFCVVIMLAGCAQGVLPGPEMGVGEAGLGLPPVDGSPPVSFDAGPNLDRGASPPVQDMFVPPMRDMNAPPMPDQGAGLPGNCQTADWTLNVNGQDRAVRFEVPANPRPNAPRVIVFHGNGDNDTRPVFLKPIPYPLPASQPTSLPEDVPWKHSVQCIRKSVSSCVHWGAFKRHPVKNH